MNDRSVLTRILAIAGTVFVFLPILAPLLFALVRFMQARRFLFDYLMPMELFPLVLVGALLLIWAVVRARSQRGLVIGGFAGAVALLVGSQALAVVTGLASGEIEPTGIWWALVMVGLVLYIVAVILVGVGGVLLLRRLFGAHPLVAMNRGA